MIINYEPTPKNSIDTVRIGETVYTLTSDNGKALWEARYLIETQGIECFRRSFYSRLVRATEGR